MLKPDTRVYHICSDVIPIAKWIKEEQKKTADYQAKNCTPIKEFRFPWQKPKLKCLVQKQK